MLGDPGRLADRVAPPLAAGAALLIHLLAALRPDGRLPTDGEARFAAAVFAVRHGRIGEIALSWSDQLAARQVGVVAALLPGVPWVWDRVCTAVLVLGALSAVLLWGVVRRLGCAGVPTALAVAIVGVTPTALALHSAATAAAVALPWLLLAALLCWRGRVLGAVAGVAAVVAALTAPLLGAVLLALAAHAVADRTLSGALRASRGMPLTAALGGAAAGLAVAAAGSGPLAGQAAPVIGTGAAAAGAACGLVVVAVAGRRLRWARPLLSPTLVVLAVLLVPGPGRAAAALTTLVLVAVLAAAVADELAARVPVRVRVGLVAAAVAAAAGAAVLALPVPAPPPAAAPAAAPLLAWAGDQQSSGAMLHADPLDRAELVAAGFPPERLRDLGTPVADVDVVLLVDRGPAGTPTAPAHCAVGTLLATLPRPGAMPAEICGARPPAPPPDPAEQAGRVRIGTSLTANPALALDPGAAEVLRQGAVDPRLMIVLAAVSGTHTLDVADFPAGVFAPPGTPRRQVLVTAVDGRPTGADVPASLRDWLRGQRPPYTPTLVRVERTGLLIGYGDVAPPGLLPS